jgi:hypothetical protein
MFQCKNKPFRMRHEKIGRDTDKDSFLNQKVTPSCSLSIQIIERSNG